MLVNIELNKEKEIIWSIPGTNVLLTFEKPAVTIDTDKLDDRQRLTVSTAIRIGRIKSVTDPDLIFRFNTKPNLQPVQQKPVAAIKVETPEDVAKKAREILNGTVSDVKKALLINKNIRLIKSMLSIETGDKKRATIIKLMKDQINKVEGEVALSMQDINRIKQSEMDASRVSLPGGQSISYAEDVIESDEGTVQIDIQKPVKGT